MKQNKENDNGNQAWNSHHNAAERKQSLSSSVLSAFCFSCKYGVNFAERRLFHHNHCDRLGRATVLSGDVT